MAEFDSGRVRPSYVDFHRDGGNAYVHAEYMTNFAAAESHRQCTFEHRRVRGARQQLPTRGLISTTHGAASTKLPRVWAVRIRDRGGSAIAGEFSANGRRRRLPPELTDRPPRLRIPTSSPDSQGTCQAGPQSRHGLSVWATPAHKWRESSVPDPPFRTNTRCFRGGHSSIVVSPRGSQRRVSLCSPHCRP